MTSVGCYVIPRETTEKKIHSYMLKNRRNGILKNIKLSQGKAGKRKQK